MVDNEGGSKTTRLFNFKAADQRFFLSTEEKAAMLTKVIKTSAVSTRCQQTVLTLKTQQRRGFEPYVNSVNKEYIKLII